MNKKTNLQTTDQHGGAACLEIGRQIIAEYGGDFELALLENRSASVEICMAVIELEIEMTNSVGRARRMIAGLGEFLDMRDAGKPLFKNRTKGRVIQLRNYGIAAEMPAPPQPAGAMRPMAGIGVRS